MHRAHREGAEFAAGFTVNTPATRFAAARSLSARFLPILKRLRRGEGFVGRSGVYLSGHFLQKAVSFLLIPVFTAHMTPADYGVIGTVTAYGGVLGTIISLGITGAVVRHYYDYKENASAQRSFLISNLLLLVTVAGAVCTVLALFGRPVWERISSGSIPFAPYVLLMLATLFIALLTPVILALYQAQQRVRPFIIMQLSMFACTIISMLLFVVGLNKGAYGQMLASLLTQAIFAGVSVVVLARQYLPAALSFDHMRAGLLFGLPLVPHLLSHWALGLADRVMIERFRSLEEVGFYTLGYNLATVLQFVAGSISQAWVPHYYEMMTANPIAAAAKVARTVAAYLTGVGGLAVVGSLFTPELLAILTPPRFHPAAPFIPPLLLGFLMLGLYVFAVAPLFYLKKTRLLPLITGFAAILNITLNYFLIPQYGALAAAWTTSACYTVLFMSYFAVAQRICYVPYAVGRGLIVLATLLGIVLVAQLLEPATIVTVAAKLGMCAGYGAIAFCILLRPFRTADSAAPVV